MAFDIEGARSAGYSDGEIADFLGKEAGFDVAGATKSGYTPGEIVGFLSDRAKPQAVETGVDFGDAATSMMSPAQAKPAKPVQPEGTWDRIEPEASWDDRGEARKGASSAVTGIKSMKPAADIALGAIAVDRIGNRLTTFDRIDRGETVPRAEGLAYQQADAAGREAIRANLLAEAGKQEGFIKDSVKLVKEYQAEQMRDRGKTVDFTDIESAKGFADWLAFNGASGAVYLAPVMLAAAVGGTPGAMAVSYGLAAGEINNDRVDAAIEMNRPGRFKNPDRQDEVNPERGIAQRVSATVPQTLAFAAPNAALDVVAGPVRGMITRPLKNLGQAAVLKAAPGQIAKDVLEEGVTGALQEVGNISAQRYAGEQDGDALTVENAKRVFNAGMAEAAGGLVGGSANVAREVAQGPIAPPRASPADILNAPTVDAAIEAATRAVAETPAAAPAAPAPASPQSVQAVDNIERLLNPTKAADVSLPDAAGAVVPGDGGQLDPVAAGGVPDGSGAGAVPGRLPGADAAEPGAGGVQVQPVPAGDQPNAALSPEVAAVTQRIQELEQAPAAQPTGEPAATWFGRRGDGYLTQGDATLAIQGRKRVSPELSWAVEPMPSGKFRLAGYAPAAVNSGDGSTAPPIRPSGNAGGIEADPDARNFVGVGVPGRSGVPDVPASQAGPGQPVGAVVPDGLAGSGQGQERVDAPADGQRGPVELPAGPAAQVAPVYESLGKTGGPGPAGGKNARSAAFDANPFKAFLGKHGLSMDAANAWAPGTKERRAAMVRGYGPIFRRSGKQLDSLAQVAVEEGFLISPDVAQLENLIGRALRGERVIPQFAEGAVEKDAQERIDRARQIEEEAAQDLAQVTDAELAIFDENDDNITDILAGGTPMTEADADRIFGALPDETPAQPAVREGRQQPDEVGPEGSPQGDRRGEGQARGSEGTEEGLSDAQRSSTETSPATGRLRPPEQGATAGAARAADGGRRADNSQRPLRDLTSPSPEEVVAQQDRAAEGERTAARDKRDSERKAKADAEVGEFRLQGSDRDADANPDQAPMFSRGKTGDMANRKDVVGNEGDTPADDDYRGQHQAPSRADGAPAHDLTGNAVYPDDIYSINGLRYYGTGSDLDGEAYSTLSSLKGRPNREVTIYRAVPLNESEVEELSRLLTEIATYQRRRILPKGMGGKSGFDGETSWYDQATTRRDELQAKDVAGTIEKGLRRVINTGDWVTISRAYAKDHGESALNGKYKIIQKKVRARDIYTAGDSFLEWGYDPQSNESHAPNSDGAPMFARAYHGSPHRFEKFELNRIGSGEGAQAFGWGLYFAGKEQVADFYRKKLSEDNPSQETKAFEFAGQSYPKASAEGHALNLLKNGGKRDAMVTAREMLADAKAGKPYAMERGVEHYERLEQFVRSFDAKDTGKIKSVKDPGQLYHVEIPEDDVMLDFNKDWTGQSQHVRDALKQAGVYKRYRDNLSDFATPMATRNKNMRGENIYAFLAHEQGSEKAASLYLDSLGIPGMKFKGGTIAGVRNAGSNYVLFNDSVVSIERAMFKRAAQEVSPAEARARQVGIQQRMDEIVENWENAPDVIVVRDMQDSLVPERVRKADQAAMSNGASGSPEGFYYEGKVYIVASEMRTRERALIVLAHESLGHFGFAGAFGKRMDAIKREVALTRRKEINAKIKQYGLDPAKTADVLYAAEEVLAEMAQATPQATLVQKAIAIIRRWLKDMGVKLEMTDNDLIVNFVLPARDWVVRGKKAKAAGAEPHFLRVFHGTPHEFDKFDSSKIGTGEGAQAYGHGLYFAGRKEVADHYRKTLSGDGYGVIKIAGNQQIDDPDFGNMMVLEVDDRPATTLTGKEGYQFMRNWLRPWQANKYTPGEQARLAMEWLDESEAAGKSIEVPGRDKQGKLYEVEIPEDGEYLLWDKPLSEQPEAVKKALSQGALASATDKTGEDAYRWLSRLKGGDQYASNFFHDAGVAGIKYLDGSSRNRTLREVKREFLAELPEDAGFDEVMDLIGDGTFSPANEAILTALAENDWLGFDYPAQAISAALGSRLADFDASPSLVKAVADAQTDATFNYVVFDDSKVSIEQVHFSRGQNDGMDKEVPKLQAELRRIEADQQRLKYESPEWEAASKAAAAVRVKLFDLTGDYYGTPKVKVARPSDEALEAEYASPDEVPADVRRWVQKNANTLTSDATDAVRWGRIADTLRDDRYPAGDLTIYRAVANGDEIRAGDWVTTEREYAEMHLARYLDGKGQILEETVDGRDVLASPTGNAEEAIYAPRELSGPISDGNIMFARGAAATGTAAANPDPRTLAEGYTNGRRTVSKVAADALPGVLGLDRSGRIQLEFAAKVKDYLAEKSGPWWERLGMKGASPALRHQLRRMKMDVAKAQEKAVAVAKESQKLSAEEREMVSDLIEQEVKAGVLPPAHAVRLAQIISTTMENQTDELVSLGMLTKDSADRWRGKYLPRFYKSKLGRTSLPDAWGDALRGLRGKTSAMKGIKGKHLKGRGLYETIPESQIKDYEALGWEVRDDGFNPSLEGDGTTQVWRDFTPAEREKMGEIRDSGFRFVMGYLQTQKDIALGRMFEGMATDPNLSARIPQDGMDVQVPDTSVTGTGAKRYGRLAGRYVAKATMDHLSQIEEAQSDIFRLYREALGLWKEGKTVLNPVSHMNNVVSNLTMAHLAGVSYHRGDKYLSAIVDFATNSPKLQAAKEAGLFLGTVSDVEIMNTLPKELRDLAVQQESMARKTGRRAFSAISWFARRPAGWAYQNEDLFFRFLIWKDATDRGMDSEDAVDYSQKFIFTYDDLPKTARRIRDFGIPFFSYTYKFIPAALSVAMTHPWRMAAPAAALYAYQAAMYAMLAGDDDEDWFDVLQSYLTVPEFRKKVEEKQAAEQKSLPPWMQGRTALGTPRALRLGQDEVTKLPLFIDISRMVPGGDIFDVSPNAGGIPFFQWMTPSHPIFTTAVAMFANKDPFFGKEITDSNDTSAEATQKRGAWLWKQFAPAIAVNNYHWQRTMNVLARANGGELPEWVPDIIGGDSTGIGRDRLPVQPGLAALQTIGIKVRPQDLEKSEDMAEWNKKKLIREIDREMSVLRRLNSEGVLNDRSLDKEWDRADIKKNRLRDGLTVDGVKKD